MSSARNQHPSTFPAVPPSLSAGEYEMRDYYATQDTPRPPPITAPYLTPYLGLRSRLSQVWINRWTILLLLVLIRTILAVVSLKQDLTSAKKEALSACTSVEAVGSAMASLPHYMSQGVNELAADGVEKAVNGLMSMLLLSVTGIEEIVVFVINLLTSTYVSLITLAVSGSLHVALQVVEDVSGFLNKTLGDIGNDIATDISTFQNDLNKFTSALNSIPKALGSSSSIPTLNINSSLDSLEHLQLPSTLDEGLDKINASIPTFAQVQNFTNNAIRTPFEDVKQLINSSLVAYKFDQSVFPVPQKEQLSFCSNNDGIEHFFQDLFDVADYARKIFIIVLLLLAIIACIPMAYREIKRWETVQKRARLIGQQDFDPLDVVQIVSRPYSSTVGIKAASMVKSPRQQILVRWIVAYGTSMPALFVLSLGLAGLLSCLFHYILLKAIEREVPALVNEVGAFADKVVNALENASVGWANSANHVIESTNNDINNDVFGWVNTTTGAMNDTLNTFVDGMTDALNATFGGTVLYDPIEEVFNCLIGLKVAGIEKALTWVSDNAHVSFPEFPNNTFSIGAAASLASDSTNTSVNSFLSNPGSDASDAISGAIVDVTDKIASAIRTEAIISACVIGLWVLIVLLGFLRALTLFFRHDKTRGEGGPVYATNDYRGAPAPAEASNSVFPSFGPPLATEPAPRYSSTEGPQDEKVGFAGERGVQVGVSGPHVRSSSYGHMGGVDEKR
ncbi:MAG: plasma membrane fusion protein prm1 [Pycnora praestabilis]|nr:MAG: plasma membrane fusion protein prm1 [Pycnora praestabilis]